MLPRFEGVPLGRIDHLVLRGWVGDLVASDLAPASVHKTVGVLVKALQAAVDSRLLAVNPARALPLPRIEHTEMRFLDHHEVATLVEALAERYRALALVVSFGGLRLGELAGLRRHRVDVLRGRVEVAEVCVEVAGRVHYGGPKTKAGHRTVALPRTVVAQLDEHMAAHTATGRDALVFTAPHGGPLRRAAFRSRVWLPAIRGAGFDGLRIHDLRHTAIALWIAAGANPKEVAARAGHTSVAFTLDRYGHLYPDADEALRDRLDAMLAAARPVPDADVRRLPR